MGLTKQEKKMLERLQQKAEEPDTPEPGRSFNINVDLGDPKQVEAARKLGLSGILDDDDDDDDDDDRDDDDDAQTEKTGPKRRGYFEGGK